jgi:hypothetical protein
MGPDMCLVVMAARAATGATVRVVKADTARLEDATNRAAREDMLMRIFVLLHIGSIAARENMNISIQFSSSSSIRKVGGRKVTTASLHPPLTFFLRLGVAWNELLPLSLAAIACIPARLRLASCLETLPPGGNFYPPGYFARYFREEVRWARLFWKRVGHGL